MTDRPPPLPKTGFLKDQDGAVTADWIVITAAVLVLTIPVVGVISPYLATATTDIGTKVVDSSEAND